MSSKPQLSTSLSSLSLPDVLKVKPKKNIAAITPSFFLSRNLPPPLSMQSEYLWIKIIEWYKFDSVQSFFIPYYCHSLSSDCIALLSRFCSDTFLPTFFKVGLTNLDKFLVDFLLLQNTFEGRNWYNKYTPTFKSIEGTVLLHLLNFWRRIQDKDISDDLLGKEDKVCNNIVAYLGVGPYAIMQQS